MCGIKRKHRPTVCCSSPTCRTISKAPRAGSASESSAPRAAYRDARLEGLVRNLFRPSYGGNRNCTLMYTLGGLMIGSDDDMRPNALMEDSPESLETNEIARGRLHKAGLGQKRSRP